MRKRIVFYKGYIAKALIVVVLAVIGVTTFVSAVFAASTYQNDVINDSATGFWTLSTGNTQSYNVDIAGSNNMTAHSLTDGPFTAVNAEENDAAVGFNGTTSYMNQASNSANSLTSNFTLEAWVRATALPGSGSSAVILAKSGAYSLGFSGSHLSFTTTRSSSDRTCTATDTATTGTNYYVVGTYDGSNMKLYINGTLACTLAATNSIDTNSNGLVLGSLDTSSQFLSGYLNDPAIYGSVLSGTQISNHYTDGKAPQGPSGTRYTRTITIDNTGNSNTLTNYQTSVTLDTASLISAGKMRSDCRDIRFNDSDNTTAINNYWVENCNSASTKIWVKVPSITASTNYHIYLYYGSTTASALSSVGNTFIRDIDNTKAYWHMDEASGTNVADGTANGYDGTAMGASIPSIVTGKFGNARSFNGSAGYISAANESTLTFGTNSRTVCAWAQTASTASGLAEIFDMGTDSNNQHFGIGRSGADLMGFGWNNDFSYANFWNTNTWHFVCLSYDGTTETLYADGSSVATATLAWNTVDGGGTYIGNDIPNYVWNGPIDEVSFFSKALSSSEVSDLYSNYGYTTGNYANHTLVRKYSAPEPTVSVGSETGV